MNLIFYQKVDPNDPRSCNAASKNGAYAERRKLRFFKYSGDDVFGTVLQEMKVDEECEGAIVLFEHERLTVDGLEKKVDGLSFRVSATPTRDFTERLGRFFFRKDAEGMAKLEGFCRTSTDEQAKEEPPESKEPKKTKTTKNKKKTKTE